MFNKLQGIKSSNFLTILIKCAVKQDFIFQNVLLVQDLNALRSLYVPYFIKEKNL